MRHDLGHRLQSTPSLLSIPHNTQPFFGQNIVQARQSLAKLEPIRRVARIPLDGLHDLRDGRVLVPVECGVGNRAAVSLRHEVPDRPNPCPHHQPEKQHHQQDPLGTAQPHIEIPIEQPLCGATMPLQMQGGMPDGQNGAKNQDIAGDMQIEIRIGVNGHVGDDREHPRPKGDRVMVPATSPSPGHSVNIHPEPHHQKTQPDHTGLGQKLGPIIVGEPVKLVPVLNRLIPWERIRKGPQAGPHPRIVFKQIQRLLRISRSALLRGFELHEPFNGVLHTDHDRIGQNQSEDRKKHQTPFPESLPQQKEQRHQKHGRRPGQDCAP